MNFLAKITLLIIPFLLVQPAFAQTKENTESKTDTLQLNEVVVTGTRVQVARKNVPVTVSSISRETIEMSNEAQVLPLISQNVPGMFVTERGVTGFGVAEGSAGQISMRGVGGTAPNTQVLVLIDGHPQFQGLFAHPLPDAYVSSDVEKVEVIRGPASIIYGSNAMAGAINLITREQDSEGISGNARVSYGSFNTQKYMGSTGYKKGKLSLFASVNHDRTDGHRDSSEFKIVNGFLKLGYQINDSWDLNADLSIADFTSDSPGQDFNPQYFGIDILRGKTSLSIKNKFEKTEGGLLAFYNFGNHEFTDGWLSEDYHAGISIFQGMQLLKGNNLTVGFDYKNVGGIANSGFMADTWHNINDVAGYAYMQQNLLRNLIVSGGIRLENNSLFGTEWVPQVGISWMATDLTTVKGSFSKGFRSPSLMELYLFAPNQNLKPERLMNYEAGISHITQNGKFFIEAMFFLIEGSNIIEIRPNDTPPPPVKRQNVGSFQNEGIELEIKYRVSNNIQVNTNYTFINTDEPRLAAPRHNLFGEVSYIINNFRTRLSMQQINELYVSTGDDETISEDYFLLNATLSYSINDYLEIFASGRNLTNQQYSVNFGYPMPGIHFNSGLNLRF